MESFATESLPEIYARHIASLVEEDVALGRIVVRVGGSIGEGGSGGRMMLDEEAFSRLVDDVAAMRASRAGVIEFWEEVCEQWTRIVTHEDRAAITILKDLPDE